VTGGAVLDVAIVGGGPSGLATAIECQRAGLSYQIIEKGGLVDSIRRFPINMVFFTTPELLEIGGLPLVCHREKPSRFEALVYYRKVALHYGLEPRLFTRVERVDRASDTDGNVFTLHLRSERKGIPDPGPVRARNVVMAIGYYENPNRLDIPGAELDKVSHRYVETHPYFGSKVAVIGGGNSAAEAALELFRAGIDVTLIHRGETLSSHLKYWVRPDIENRIARREIAGWLGAVVTEIRMDSLTLRDRHGEMHELPNDFVLALLGYRPPYGFLESLGVRSEGADGRPVTDPETFATEVPGLYLAGGVVAGRRTNMVFIENGRFHGEAIVRHICATR
jgi:thioredoxin reductase (NADPH)